MSWALDEAQVTDPTQALVLVALADNAQDDGRNAFPSQATLARRARVSDRTIRRILAQLEADGVIRRGDQRVVEHLPADRRPVVWDLVMAARTADRPDMGDRSLVTGGSSTTGRGRLDDRTPVTKRPDTGVLQTVLEPSLNGESARATRPPDTNTPPRCTRHASLPLGAEPPCNDCRREREAWEAEQGKPTGPRRDDLPWCRHPACDQDTRLRDTPDGVRRCPECHSLAGPRPRMRITTPQFAEPQHDDNDGLMAKLAALAAAERETTP
jgi:Helix-turn-helix domain